MMSTKARELFGQRDEIAEQIVSMMNNNAEQDKINELIKVYNEIELEYYDEYLESILYAE